MDVSVIIVNYNTCELVQNCIESIIQNTAGLQYELIVVDNNSIDRSKEILSADERIIFVESYTNIGFGRANNLGFEKSSGKYIFFLNSDTILLNNAIKQMFDFMENHRSELNIGALGCLLQNHNRQICHSFSDFPKMGRFLMDEWGDHVLKRFGRRMKRLDEGIDLSQKSSYFPVDYVTGADMFVYREVINQYGGFDKDFFMYYEESEMQNRWRKYGKLQSYILKGPQIVHLEGKSQINQSVDKYLRQLRSQMLYFKKTNPSIKYYSFRIIFLLGRIITMPFQKMDYKQKDEYKKILLKF